MSGSKVNRKERSHPFLFVCLFCFTLQNKLIAEHLVPSCQCHVWSRETGQGSRSWRWYQYLFLSFFLSFFLFRFHAMVLFFSWKLLLFFHVSEFSGIFRDAPCSGFYRRPIKLFFISLITSNIVRRFDLSRTQNFRRNIAYLILLVLKVFFSKIIK